MPRASRTRPSRSVSRDRHGRGIRASVAGPQLPWLRTRRDFFESCVTQAIDYLRELWPEDLSGVLVEVGGMPPAAASGERVERWRIDRRTRRVVLYRVPIERLARLHKDDDWHRRSFIESCVFRAVAELLGRDPWEIAPERYRHF